MSSLSWMKVAGRAQFPSVEEVSTTPFVLMFNAGQMFLVFQSPDKSVVSIFENDSTTAHVKSMIERWGMPDRELSELEKEALDDRLQAEKQAYPDHCKYTYTSGDQDAHHYTFLYRFDNVERLLVGESKNSHGNTIAVQIRDPNDSESPIYLRLLGCSLFAFKAPGFGNITTLFAPVGNSAVPYPVLLSENGVWAANYLKDNEWLPKPEYEMFLYRHWDVFIDMMSKLRIDDTEDTREFNFSRIVPGAANVEQLNLSQELLDGLDATTREYLLYRHVWWLGFVHGEAINKELFRQVEDGISLREWS